MQFFINKLTVIVFDSSPLILVQKIFFFYKNTRPNLETFVGSRFFFSRKKSQKNNHEKTAIFSKFRSIQNYDNLIFFELFFT
jgi:hypothetical protein